MSQTCREKAFKNRYVKKEAPHGGEFFSECVTCHGNTGQAPGSGAPYLPEVTIIVNKISICFMLGGTI